METTQNQLQNAAEFLFAGNALFTVQNISTGGRYTFKVQASEPSAEHPEVVHFVKVLAGSDNVNDYRYIGIVRQRSKFFPKKGVDGTQAVAFDWLLRHITTLPENVRVLHEGRCGRCGRVLTVPESIERGIGPECASKM